MKKLSCLLLLLLPVMAFSAELDMPAGWIMSLILKFIQGNPIMAQIVFFIGLLRLLIKPVMTIIGEIVKLTASPNDDIWYQDLLNSKIYKTICYLLDWFASIKLPKKG